MLYCVKNQYAMRTHGLQQNVMYIYASHTIKRQNGIQIIEVVYGL